MGKLILRLTIAGISLFVTIQALYWPLINKPGTELYWWQNYQAARIGLYVGFPIWKILFHSPLSGTANIVFAWILIVGWTSFIYFLSGAVINVLRKYAGRQS
ncbi:MAG: hypothetical protein DMG48_08130 [Acidobacteria bacterium]|nr:MAG: hypothetical protein DMG48_08130 [Acidobacteriota bacterium]